MKLLVIADVHSHLMALEAVLKDVGKVDKIIYLGDYVSDGYQDNEVIDLISKTADYAISGNRDYDLVHREFDNRFYNERPLATSQASLSDFSKDYLDSLESAVVTTVEGCRILLIHGHHDIKDFNDYDRSFDKLIEHYDFDLCLFGHTHQSLDVIYRGKRFINPGSVGIPADGPSHKYGVVRIVSKEIKYSQKELPIIKEYFTDFCQSDYYLKNPIWASLILDAITDGNNAHHLFFSCLEAVSDDSPELFNSAWEKAFTFYTRKSSS